MRRQFKYELGNEKNQMDIDQFEGTRINLKNMGANSKLFSTRRHFLGKVILFAGAAIHFKFPLAGSKNLGEVVSQHVAAEITYTMINGQNLNFEKLKQSVSEWVDLEKYTALVSRYQQSGKIVSLSSKKSKKQHRTEIVFSSSFDRKQFFVETEPFVSKNFLVKREYTHVVEYKG